MIAQTPKRGNMTFANKLVIFLEKFFRILLPNKNQKM